jgi:hypothetical protein
MCRLQGASFIRMSYLKIRNGCVVVMYCECWWPVYTGCCGLVCYVVVLCVMLWFGGLCCVLCCVML